MKCVGFTRVAGVLAHFLCVAAVVVYGLLLFGPPATTGIVRLTTNGTGSVDLDLGYLGLCISPPSVQGITNDTASRLCQSSFSLDHDKELTELVSEFFDAVDLESPGEDYRDSVSTLLAFATVLREDIFPGMDLIASFALLIFGGFIVVVPLYFNTGRGRDAFMVMFSALVLGFGIMAAAAAVFSTVRALSLLQEVGALTIGVAGSEPLAATEGEHLHTLLYAGIGLNGAFIFLVCMVGFARRATQAKGFQGFQGFQGLPVFVHTAPPVYHGPPNAKKPKRGLKFGKRPR